jgi:hypothetical protein
MINNVQKIQIFLSLPKSGFTQGSKNAEVNQQHAVVQQSHYKKKSQAM